MGKPLLFYTIDEQTDVRKYCEKKGLKPYKNINKILDNCLLEHTVQYIKDGFVYDVLECDQCYSGYMITLMRLPKMPYEELLNVALSSKSSDERAGAIGVILKDHPIQFENYLLKLSKSNPNTMYEKKKIKRMISFINNFVKDNTSYVWCRDRVLTLCEEIC